MTLFNRSQRHRLEPLASRLALCAGGLVTLWLSACTQPVLIPAKTPQEAEVTGASSRSKSVSLAASAKAYRMDAAQHVYALNKNQVFQGRLPAMLYAIGVLDVEIDRQGQVKSFHWKRAPGHAPEAMAQIESMVKAAAPFPMPSQLGKVTYTDVWLWDKSGKFQLDTLTEGQD